MDKLKDPVDRTRIGLRIGQSGLAAVRFGPQWSDLLPVQSQVVYMGMLTGNNSSRHMVPGIHPGFNI
ncbi:hypothetical protein D3C81_2068260 [compost metagenome]